VLGGATISAVQGLTGCMELLLIQGDGDLVPEPATVQNQKLGQPMA